MRSNTRAYVAPVSDDVSGGRGDDLELEAHADVDGLAQKTTPSVEARDHGPSRSTVAASDPHNVHEDRPVRTRSESYFNPLSESTLGDNARDTKIDAESNAQRKAQCQQLVAQYKKELKNDSDSSYLHNSLGVQLAKLNRLDEAIEHYNTAFRLDSNFFPALYNLGRAKYRQGKLDEALALYEQSLGMHPEDIKTHNSMGIVLVEQGRIQDAQFHFNERHRIVAIMLTQEPIWLKFKDKGLEEEFSSGRTSQASFPTRILLVASLMPAFYGLMLYFFNMVVGPGDHEDHDEHELTGTVAQDVVMYAIETATGLITLALTWHTNFFKWKPYILTIYITVYFVLQLVMSWLSLKHVESEYDEAHAEMRENVFKTYVDHGIAKGGLSKALYSSLNALTRDFSVALALPQLCGLRWTSMPFIFLVYLTVYCSFAFQSPNIMALLDPVFMLSLMAVAVMVAYWAEKAERLSFKLSKLYITEKECRAQANSDWRRAAAERNESDIAKTTAETALKTRSQFVAWIFHEIRNPLNAMFGAIQMLGTTASTPKQKEWVAMAKASADMVSNVLNDVLCLSKIEEGNMKLDKKLFVLADAVKSVRFMFIEMAAKNSISLECSVADDVPRTVYADEVRLKEVLANFCSNAIKFTPNGGSVKLQVSLISLKGDLAEIDGRVIDSGRGISPEDFDKLFVAYSQITPSLGRRDTTGRNSTGLGLCISKHIIKAHGGENYVHSDGIGKGSTFGFRMTLLVGDDEAEAQKAVEDNDNDNIIGAAKSEASRHILIVDDDEFNAEVVTDMITTAGWTCDTVYDGRQALELISERGDAHYSCIVSDCIMPVLDGWALTEEVKRRGSLLPVIGLTGSVSEADINRCREVGMCEVLTKPVKLEDLVRTVLDVVGRSSRVLLVDDDEFNRTIVQDMLEEGGWTCNTAPNGKVALEMLNAPGSHEYACVVTDCSMPVMDGFELARLLREQRNRENALHGSNSAETSRGWQIESASVDSAGEDEIDEMEKERADVRRGRPMRRRTPMVIGLTGDATEDHKQRCFESGMSRVLTKPIDMEVLFGAIAELRNQQVASRSGATPSGAG